MAKRSNVVSIYDWMPADQAIVQRAEPATVIILPVIRIEQPISRPARPRLSPSQRLKSLRKTPDYTPI